MIPSKENAFTGLEAAIVLIAFVVVAAVFSYVLLGAGFYTTQTAQEAVHSSVTQASSSLEVVGNVMGIRLDDTPDQLSYVNISVALTAGGTAMDLTQMVISYSDTNMGRNPSIVNTTDLSCGTLLHSTIKDDNNLKWCVSQKINDLNVAGSENNLLEPNEIWVLSIMTPETATVGTRMTVNMQPAVGAVLPITRALPGDLTKVMTL